MPVPAAMTNVLILLGLTETVRKQYRDRLQARFPEVPMTLVDHHSKVGPHIAAADALDHLHADADRQSPGAGAEA